MPGDLETNLVPRAHVPFGQHQDTELWNNQQARSQSFRVVRCKILYYFIATTKTISWNTITQLYDNYKQINVCSHKPIAVQSILSKADVCC